ncbi:MAG: substrate-binding domain-containing protein [Limnochordia bacterium]|nr:substrate-binding domain-containing protein [Limnochordia bacterium]MDD2629739.1 substrate-binding domain-containing protein [Limnochordia bacterium]
MRIFSITEPLVEGRYWSSGYTRGIRQEAAKIKAKFTEITPGELGLVMEESQFSDVRPVVIVNCISKAWTLDCLTLLTDAGIHPLLLTPFGGRTEEYSTVSLDFYGTFLSLFRYLDLAGKGRIALLGLNPDSVNDTVKIQAFSAYQRTAPAGTEHIFWNQGSLLECCQRFFQHREDYDAIVCTNDVVAIRLINFLNENGVRVPEDCWVAAMGNTFLGGLISPSITVVEMDCQAIGRQAARLYAFLRKNPCLSALRAVVPGHILVRSSTADFPVYRTQPRSERTNTRGDTLNFYADHDVAKIFLLENLFQNSDETDLRILRGLLCGKTYAELAEEVFLSERGVKYRTYRMVELAECSSRGELLSMLTQYVD